VNPVFKPISHGLATDTVIAKHYQHRGCPITWAFGVFVDDILKGVLTVGKPCSSTVCSGVCGPERSSDVYELNRLWLDDTLPRNGESRFIGWCLRWFAHHCAGLILVSYADTGQNHIGTVYQATNWLYTGMSAKFKDKIEGRVIERSRKHRYVWLNNLDKNLLRWKVMPYPKRAV
jgi:hypothetical protein